MRPSTAHIWGPPGGCTGYHSMTSMCPYSESESAREGSAAHWVGALLINMIKTPLGKPEQKNSIISKPAPNGVFITEEIFETAAEYAAIVTDEIRRTESSVFGTEATFLAPSIHERLQGTVDAYMYDEHTQTLTVWDFKYGLRPVDAYENWQLLCYAAAIRDNLEYPIIKKVKMCIVQPRAFQRAGITSVWESTDISKYVAQLRSAAHEEPTIRTGSHCKYCVARHACPAAIDAGMTMYESSMRPASLELTPTQLGSQMTFVKRAREQLEYLETGYEEQARSLMQKGVDITGWTIEEGLGNRKWAKSHEEIFRLGDLLGVDLREPPKPISPAKAEKLGVKGDILSAYVERNKTQLNVVECNQTHAKRIFSHE